MPRPASSVEVLDAVSAYFTVSVADLVSPKRGKLWVMKARHVAAWLLYLQGRSQAEVGEILGGRDHSTIRYSLGVVRGSTRMMEWAEEIRESLEIGSP